MWDWLAAAVGIQHRPQRGDGVAVRAVVDVHATAVGFHGPAPRSWPTGEENSGELASARRAP